MAAHALPPRQPDITYAAPSRLLQVGEVLKPDNIQLIAWPASNPLEGAHANGSDLLGRQVMYPLGKGQPILDRDLAAPGSGTGLAVRIPDGMRAIALRSDEVVGVAGFLVPGSHGDVLVTYRSDGSPGPVTSTVLQDAVVIAAGNKVEPDPDGKPATATVVTLLLTPDQAQRAVLASTQGAIHFVLRNGTDAVRTPEAPIQLSQLGAPPRQAVAKPQPKRATIVDRNPYGVETVFAGQPSAHANGGAAQ